jgi:apolipoprotein N-acyltransferase
MLQVILRRIGRYYDSANRWYLPLLCGLLYALPHPPFNFTLHPAFAPMPLFACVSLVPLLFFATRKPRRRALLHSYLYCAVMILGQCYWIGFVTVKGYWILVLIGVALISIVWGAYYLTAALALRWLSQRLPRLYIFVFPAVWVLIEYFRTLTDLAFPWALVGYSATGILPLAQFSSFTGVWGLSYLIVLGNIVIWELLQAIKNKDNLQQKWVAAGAWAAITIGIFVWGLVRMNAAPPESKIARIALMQSYMDQFNWEVNSIDTAVIVSDSMVMIAAKENPDVMVFPESAIHCYLNERPEGIIAMSWANKTGIPIVLGSLSREFTDIGNTGDKKRNVYNTAFLVKDNKLTPYHKILLVPFSEGVPFKMQILPILSRVNLDKTGFTRGHEETLFRITDNLEAAPYICYEIIFPSFVRKRLSGSTDMLLNVTNDGWFKRTSGPYQHAAMAQMRSIDNGITLARSANSGISMFVDPYGRITARTGLYTRTILIKDIPLYRLTTFYTQYGDWFVALCAILVAIGITACFISRKRPGEITNPLLIEEQKLVPANQ